MAKGADVKPKPTGKKKAAGKDERPQAERFIETARIVCADKSGKTLDDAFERIVVQKNKIELG